MSHGESVERRSRNSRELFSQIDESSRPPLALQPKWNHFLAPWNHANLVPSVKGAMATKVGPSQSRIEAQAAYALQ
ncbi:Gentisate 1,2-dioxygenase [Fusarium oxysporum f. sp. albedinis]|nr:Gentisate 1,2-dioxygenase [Fusarium oxysporum f. sp. albedinis]